MHKIHGAQILGELLPFCTLIVGLRLVIAPSRRLRQNSDLRIACNNGKNADRTRSCDGSGKHVRWERKQELPSQCGTLACLLIGKPRSS